MAEGFITRKGGVGVVVEQTLAPTITEVSTGFGTINFTITNNDTETVTIFYRLNSLTAEGESISLLGNATSNTLTIDKLDVSPAILYATAVNVNKLKSNVTEKSFTFTPAGYIQATGGDILTYEESGKFYKSHTFTSSGNFVVNNLSASSELNKVDYLIIGGGGAGGGAYASGGGGAGGYRTTLGTSGRNSSPESKITVSQQSYSVIIGASGVPGTSQSNATSTNGTNTSALNITALGGGAGGGYQRSGNNGGSGGGAYGGGTVNSTTYFRGLGTANQGFDGGYGGPTGAGGGGGAGENGSNAVGNVGGRGGDGLSSTIRNGNVEIRAGGGSGSSFQSSTPVPGGAGGGGQSGHSGQYSPAAANATIPNSGSGGGGAHAYSATYTGGLGASGIVIIRYEVGAL